MRLGVLITIITIFFIANTYHEGKYVHKLKSWKKYYQMAGIAFVGISAYAFIKKNPSQATSLLSHANGIIKYMPIDKEAGDFLSPILSSVSNGGGLWNQNMQQNNMQQGTGNMQQGTGNMQQGNMQQGTGNMQQSNMQQGNNLTGQQRRMLRSGNGNTKRSVSETKKKFVAAEQGWKCGECKQQLPAWFEVDHKIRLDSGGSNHIDNLVALCRDCHGKKTALENL